MKKYMVWLISALMAVSMTACSNAQKKDTKDQAQITTAAKENATQTEAAKTTSKKEKKKDKKKSKKSKKNSKKTKSSTAKKKETSTTTAKKKKVNKPCNVVVIGGGTAGLEAACTAAEVGCTTFLFEKNDHLGGLAVEISKIPDKKRLRDFPDYLVHRASKLTNLFIFKGQEATLPLIKALHPNIIVNSTGSNPLLPPIKGLHDHIDKEGSKVASITGMINHLADYPEDCTGKKVVVVGGGAVGLDVVEYFAPKGAQVSIVEMMPQIGKDLDPVSKCGTNTLMREHNVNQMTETALCEVKADAFTVKANGEEKDLPFDYGFVCLGMRANAPVLDEIREAFADTNVEIINIGDSVRARRIIDGVQEGHNILNVLADHEYL